MATRRCVTLLRALSVGRRQLPMAALRQMAAPFGWSAPTMAHSFIRGIPAATLCSVTLALALAMASSPAGAASAARLQTATLLAVHVPEAIREQAKDIVQAIQWTDAAGTNVVVLSQTRERKAHDGTRQAQLHARHFTISAAGEWQKRWQLMDEVTACPLDLLCAFLRHSIAVSDVDGDGLAEVSFVYRVDCFGGIDPIVQKLVIVHRGIKHLVRGRTVLFDENGRPLDPEHFALDASLQRAPAPLRRFAIQKWRRFQNHGLRHLGEP